MECYILIGNDGPYTAHSILTKNEADPVIEVDAAQVEADW